MKKYLLPLFLVVCFPGFAHAATGAGTFDPLFGTNGRTVFSYGSNYDYGKQIIVQPDGKYLIAGYGSNLGANIGIGFVARHNRDGSFDTSFNGNGRYVSGTETVGGSFLGMALQPDGKIIAVGNEYLPAGNIVRAYMIRLTANGTPDPTFGTAGIVRLAPSSLAWVIFFSVAVRPDGAIIVNAREFDSDGSKFFTTVHTYLANGQPDLTFGTAGRVSLSATIPNLRNSYLNLQPDGKLLLHGYLQNADSSQTAIIARLNANGSVDAGFASNGAFRLSLPGFSSEFDDLALSPNGTMTAVGFGYADSAYKAVVVRLSSAGVPDPGFGQNGVVTLPAPVALAQGVVLQPDGKTVVSGAVPFYKAVVLRLLSNGQLDTSFGTGGLNQDFGYSRSYGDRMALDVDGKIVLSGTAHLTDDDAMIARLIGDEVTTPVAEFFNTTLGHYFVTANPAEAAAIDGGAAGPGWSRTTETFKSGGPNRVCRFYGNPEINPITGSRRGPNSHFYTIDTAECAAVKLDSGWRFESYDFNGWPKTGPSTCPATTVPVLRVYNNRFAFNDSNHRYTTKMSIYNQMIAAGWQGEGVVFCAPA